MRVVGIIPARYDSSRFPGKPLVDINGKSMIRRVYEQCVKCKYLDQVVVATDDERIFSHVNEFGFAVMTSTSHESGTDRCEEAVSQLDGKFDYVVNIQGDEPFISPNQITLLIKEISSDNSELGTLVKKIEEEETLWNNNTPKVVISVNNEALYFSRQAIPHVRDSDTENWLENNTFYKHIGIYAYRIDVLNSIVRLPQSNLEKLEKLEQLRWLENGYRVKVGITNEETIGIDTPEDLMKIKHLL